MKLTRIIRTIECVAILASIGGMIQLACTPKNTVGAVCPTNAICDKVDFGVGAITVCLSPEDLIKLQAVAAQQRQLNGEYRHQDAGN